MTMTAREMMIRSALLTGDDDGADRLRTKTDEEVDIVLRAFADIGRQMGAVIQEMATEFAKAAPAMRCILGRMSI